MARHVSGSVWATMALGAWLGALLSGCGATTDSKGGSGGSIGGAGAGALGGSAGTGGDTVPTQCAHDADKDRFCPDLPKSSPQFDCDDNDAARHPGAVEVLNAIDDDCNGIIDDGLESACPWTMTEPPGGCESATQLVAGEAFACVLTDVGRVLCWGLNYAGSLGMPDLTNAPVPVAVPGVTGAKSLVAGSGAVCALREADAVCWGGGAAYPFVVALPPDTAQLAIGFRPKSNYELYALDATGQVWRRALTGDSAATQFGVLARDIKRLVAGGELICAIDSSDNLICPLGEPTVVTLSSGQPIDFAITGGTAEVCYKTTGNLHCGTLTTSAEVEGTANAVGAAINNDVCAFDAEGTLLCRNSSAPKTVTDATAVALGFDFGCVLRKSGKVSCWGNPAGGKLGDGRAHAADTADSTDTADEPVDVRPGPLLNLPPIVLLGPAPLGACDSPQDLSTLFAFANGARGKPVYPYLSSCLCESGPQPPTDCYLDCAQKAGFTPACSACYAALSTCSGTDCYNQFLTCAGYPVDFLAYPLTSAIDQRCEGTKCLSGARVSEPCQHSSDCMSGACQALRQTATTSICVVSDTVKCSADSPYCKCSQQAGSQTFCGP